MTQETSRIDVDGTRLVAERWPGGGPPVVLLHAGVCDRRSWHDTAERLGGVGRLLAYDRRGFGDSPVSSTAFRHVDDLIAVLDRLGDEPAWLVGSSMGGQVALDAALTARDRVAGLVLLAPAVSGAPDPDRLDPDTQRLSDLLDAATAAGDLDEVNRLETWLWLDGPAAPEGRVQGVARDSALAMNAVVLRNGVPEDVGGSGRETWQELGRIEPPVTVAWGDLDMPFLIERCQQLAERLPGSRTRVLPGHAHLPYLESPQAVAELIADAVSTH